MAGRYYKKQGARTKDKGVTRSSVIKAMAVCHTLQNIDWWIRSQKLPTDCTVKTALDNMLKDGLIEIVNHRRSAYDARWYELKRDK